MEDEAGSYQEGNLQCRVSRAGIWENKTAVEGFRARVYPSTAAAVVAFAATKLVPSGLRTPLGSHHVHRSAIRQVSLDQVGLNESERIAKALPAGE
jgi:hypothetical protein